MPRIKLKPNSPEYADQKTATDLQFCDMPGCEEKAEHKAPKHRGLNEYYHFCFDHIKEYNKAWNFFDGMADEEVQDHILKSVYGFRPTWKYGVNSGHPEDILYEKAWQAYNFTDEKPYNEHFQNRKLQENMPNAQEIQALAVMGLEPPITLQDIKNQYKALAKKHHPDLNKGDTKAGELFKQINMAYTILKVAYEKFETLPDRE